MSHEKNIQKTLAKHRKPLKCPKIPNEKKKRKRGHQRETTRGFQRYKFQKTSLQTKPFCSASGGSWAAKSKENIAQVHAQRTLKRNKENKKNIEN